MKTKKSIMLVLFCCFVLSSCVPSTVVPEYETYVSQFLNDMREYLDQKFEDQTGSQLRAISADFNENIYDLQGLTVLAFGEKQLQLLLSAYESPKMANAAISSFEVPPNSDSFSDCAFVIRPNANLRAPIMHGDGLKYMGGMGGKLSMDFYMVNPSIDNETIDAFFGEEKDTLENALALVKEWRVTESSSFTDHLNDYKTKYRLEIADPGRDNASAIQRYTDAAYTAFTLYVDAYMNSLNSLSEEDNETLIQANITGMSAFIENQVENDFVYQMGGMILGDELNSYFLDAFWRQDVYFTRK